MNSHQVLHYIIFNSFIFHFTTFCCFHEHHSLLQSTFSLLQSSCKILNFSQDCVREKSYLKKFSFHNFQLFSYFYKFIIFNHIYYRTKHFNTVAHTNSPLIVLTSFYALNDLCFSNENYIDRIIVKKSLINIVCY